MRIITGSAKGRRLKMPGGGKTRPAMDKVKGATFNMIAEFVPEARILDLFAGSGNLGIEALSRGASYAAFVDAARECTGTIKENLELTRLSDRGEIFTCDCLKYLQRHNQPHFDLVFIDPPYLKGLLEPILKYIPECPMFSPDTLFIIERQKKDVLGLEAIPHYRLLDERIFGDTVITFFRLKAPATPDTQPT
ncbi:MAG: 16S rRNA (guanine(966)-N(2))-methyltransferase RsmD [Candidatus Riflebacteria bacterium HGW-Riflebacteria-2]|jgi:16S rRNA (guanine(966)-N(2))-methyltransferase RsmD|nr:MAG: 16S rRNA (guanine(966)-N(2))-methyltransferase RsmD [Candidatus Riflebacteria bacterium HGW-Riflebacteria-2]